jgi:hypothetical protein
MRAAAKITLSAEELEMSPQSSMPSASASGKRSANLMGDICGAS